MVKKIEKDVARFREIVKGAIRKDLRKYITRGELIGRKGREIVSIPVPQIEIPRFRFGERQMGGVGQGEGDEGTPIAVDPSGEGTGEAGDQPGEHVREVEITLEELAEILGEELELPRIQPKGKSEIVTEKNRYSAIRRTGPESLRHFRRTFREALKRQVSAQNYDYDNPVIVPIREDVRYKSWKETHLPETNAVVFYIMDVSGSMGDEQKELVRIESFWIDTWLRANYQGVQTRYIVHDAVAHEVDRETFFHLRESGGTIISSAYKLSAKILEKDYPSEDWNIYFFQFSDGDNWGEMDNKECLRMLQEELLPRSNLFGYGQVRSAYGSG
ncbi:MAG TPA: DUF444 family protein, partial [Bacteroidetes bacterium]|nr:DUF444 family protein [Bacteroidota bacterium]